MRALVPLWHEASPDLDGLVKRTVASRESERRKHAPDLHLAGSNEVSETSRTAHRGDVMKQCTFFATGIICALILRPLHVAAVLGLNNDSNTDRNMRRNHYACAVGKFCWFVGGRGGLALHGGLGFSYRQCNPGR
jgi:hypothetical protein